MTKEQLAQWLVELDENVLQVAIMYAENYLKYGVDITEKWNTAVRQQYSLHKAELEGFINGQNLLVGAIVLCKDCKFHDYLTGGCKHLTGSLAPIVKTKDDWFCADGERKEGR